MLPAVGADELLVRLRLAIGRRRNAMNGTLKFGDLFLLPASFTGSLDGKDLCLTLTEFKLLNFLVQHAGRALTRTRLMHEAWGFDSNGRVRTVDVHLHRRCRNGSSRRSRIFPYFLVVSPSSQAKSGNTRLRANASIPAWMAS